MRLLLRMHGVLPRMYEVSVVERGGSSPAALELVPEVKGATGRVGGTGRFRGI